MCLCIACADRVSAGLVSVSRLALVCGGRLTFCLTYGFAFLTLLSPGAVAVPGGEHHVLHENIGAVCPGEFSTPNAQADKDEQPAGAGGDEHNQPGDKAEGAYADDEWLVEMTHDRMRVHALLAGFKPAVKATGFAFLDFIFNGFQGWSFQTCRRWLSPGGGG